jgi:DnaJ like chaperone protein
MRIWGKVLGAFFGFLLGNIFGALLGLWIGHRFDRGMGNFAFRAPTQQQQAVFFHATFRRHGPHRQGERPGHRARRSGSPPT